ncbi:Phosphatidylinositol 4-kinase pik1alpha (PI4-kinase)(PtdIns-4-kinase) [Coemansia aciculifera]|nr:Phosphatidylinositol 4-kinase pik1alpha (PI4-kinase)(PtdIns-4-kinase) [Coemansia aciculifera]
MTQKPDSLPQDGSDSLAAESTRANKPDTYGDMTTNSSLLLRLFTSQFFDSWLAVSYLFRYPHIPGVQHYLCNELRKFPLDEVEFFLPQLVHLLITRPNESTAIESLLLDMSLQSSHVAMILYWYLQAYLSDLAPNPRTVPFKHCQRMFNQVQELLFTDIAPELIIDTAEPTQHAYLHAMENVKSAIAPPGRLSSLASRFRTMLRLAPQVRENSQSAFVGISAALASFGAPSLAPTMGWLALAQGQCVKLSERAGEEPELPQQYKSLASKSRPSISASLARSASVARSRVEKRATHAKKLSRDLSRPRAPGSAVHSTFSADAIPESPAGAAGFEHGDRMSSSQPDTPSVHGVENMQAAGTMTRASSSGNLVSETSEALDLESGQAAEPISAASDNSASSLESFSPLQRAASSGRPRTPSGRTSIDSCRTVAVMETLERPRSMLASTGMAIDAAAAAKDSTAAISRKSYLSKAAKQFQRNAKVLDRRMSRPIDIAKVSTDSSHQTASITDHVVGDSDIHGSCEDRAATMRAALDDMAVFMERERLKLERRTGYFSAEIKFMTTLMDISQRVCAVSRLGRQQFLKAELTLLNHNLDKSTCIPLWCPDSNGLCHHRIVRIPTEDTVVLNSAERAPYLLTLEVLEPERSDHAESIWSASVSGEGPCLAMLATDSTAPGVGGIHSDPVSLYVDPAELDEISPSKEKTIDFHVSVDAVPGKSVAPRPPSLVLPIATPTPMSPAAGEDVDEQLMVEVFGDIDNISDIPDTPLSPAARRRQSGSYGVSGQRMAGKDSARAISSPAASLATEREPLHLNRQTPPADKRHRPSLPQRENSPALLAVPATPRTFISQEEIRARMRTASVLLAQLARQQKALGIKVANLVVPQPANVADSDGARAKSDMSDTLKRRSKLGNATSQALAMEEIREKLIREMMQLEELRLKQPGLDSVPSSAAVDDGTAQSAESDIGFDEVEFKDDPSAKVLKEDWESKKARIRRASPYGRRKNWNLLSVIVKEGADLRQEQLALQLIREMQRIWQREQIDVFVQYYRIMVTGEGCGLMETITNTVSVHSIKKEFYSRNTGYVGPPYTLYNYFVTSYGTPDTQRFRDAQDNFMRSLVSYSLITYVLQIRDRHNGNILLDTAGHIIHIDFGFMLYNSPGSVGFEQAPFKFPMEYVDILGGRGSAKFVEFRQLLAKAFLGLRKHADNVCLLVEMMLKDSPLPCLGGGAATVTALRDRFHLALSEQQAEELVESLLLSSCDNITTRMYDAFQYYSNGIL